MFFLNYGWVKAIGMICQSLSLDLSAMSLALLRGERTLSEWTMFKYSLGYSKGSDFSSVSKKDSLIWLSWKSNSFMPDSSFFFLFYSSWSSTLATNSLTQKAGSLWIVRALISSSFSFLVSAFISSIYLPMNCLYSSGFDSDKLSKNFQKPFT
jgi:hypothetical protein